MKVYVYRCDKCRSEPCILSSLASSEIREKPRFCPFSREGAEFEEVGNGEALF
ncbi:MAG: hypothetical protein QW734_06390 [Candidatus Bathyarchaeia archaeon]